MRIEKRANFGNKVQIITYDLNNFDGHDQGEGKSHEDQKER